jgi:hypothetical protein
MATDSAALLKLLEAYIESDPRLRIWRHYPDIPEVDDDYTDQWACREVSTEFATFARRQGWAAEMIHAEDPEEAFAFDHFWVRLTGGGIVTDVDWTARQYHNLFEAGGYAGAVLALPWPLTWEPAVVGPSAHLIVGRYRKFSVLP